MLHEDPDHIYYDITITNAQPRISTAPNNNYDFPTPQTEFPTFPPDLRNFLPEPDFRARKVIPAYFNDTLTQPIVNRASDYSCSIIRFSFPAANIPIGIFPNTRDENTAGPLGIPVQKNLYSVCLQYINSSDTIGDFEPQFLEYIPLNTTNLTPYDEAYWYIEQVQQWCDMINKALYQSFYNLYTRLTTPGPYPTGLPTTPPWITYDPVTELFTLNGDARYINEVTGINRLTIYFNNGLFDLFDTFKQQDYNFNQDWDFVQINPIPPPYSYRTDYRGRNVLLQVKNLGNDNISGTLPAAYNLPVYPIRDGNFLLFYTNYQIPQGQRVIKMTQEVPSVQRLINARGIAFLTYNLPIVSNYVRNTKNINSGLPNFKTFLTDIDLPFDNFKNKFVNVYYSPSGEYRYIDLQSNRPINQIDIKVVWIDNYGDYHDLFIVPGDDVRIKILFKKKGQMIDK